MFYIANKDWDKILGYAEEAYDKHKSEIGGMAVMIEDKEGDWTLEEPVILKQVISSGNTVLEKEALAIYYTKQAKKMGKQNYRFCWWHSHHTMSAFWSGTDKTAIKEFEDGDFSFALVVNLKGEYKFRVSVWKPVEAHEDVDLQVLRSSRITKGIAKEVEKFCEKETNAYTWNKSFRSNTYGGQGYLALNDARNYDIKKISHADLVDEVDDIHTEVADGTLNYKAYKVKVDDLNGMLKKEDSLYQIKLLSENELQNVLHLYPYQVIEYVNDNIYDDSFYGVF